MSELYGIGGGLDLAVHFNPGGRFHGWLFSRHPDGQYVSVRPLTKIDPHQGPMIASENQGGTDARRARDDA